MPGPADLPRTASACSDEEVLQMAEISRLPGPVADLWEWQLQGACREADPTLFFHPEGERGPLAPVFDYAGGVVITLIGVLLFVGAY